jgi:hypothetical protein
MVVSVTHQASWRVRLEERRVVLRSREIRALIELVKLQQANLDNLTIIGVDCLGTYEVDDTCWCWSIPADWAP